MASAQGGAGRSLLKRIGSGINFSLGRGGSCVGLNIGYSSVKLIEVSKKKNNWTLERYGATPSLGLMSEHREIINTGGMIQSIQLAAKRSGITAREVCTGIAGTGIVIKNLNIRVQDLNELEDQIFWEAEQYIPFDIHQTAIDYSVLRQQKDQSYEVAVIAVRRTLLDQYTQVIEEAQYRPRVIDAEIFSLLNVFEANYSTKTTEAQLLVDLGALHTKMCISVEARPLLVKDVPLGGSTLSAAIQRDLKVSDLDAESLKVSRPAPREIIDIVQSSIKAIAVEIKKTIDFYIASSMGPPVTEIYLAGGGAQFDPLLKIIEETTRVKTLKLNPFEKIEINSSYLNKDEMLKIASEIVVPLGLAMRAGDAK